MKKLADISAFESLMNENVSYTMNTSCCRHTSRKSNRGWRFVGWNESPDDYYKILGLESGASNREIRNAYKRLAKQWHPDRNPGNEEEATGVFRRINEAYDILMKQKANPEGSPYREIKQIAHDTSPSVPKEVGKVNNPFDEDVNFDSLIDAFKAIRRWKFTNDFTQAMKRTKRNLEE